MRVLESLFVQNNGELGPIAWWELHRIPYNMAVGAVGILSIVVMELIANAVVPAGEDFVEPFALLAGVIIAGIIFNLWYTLGWVRERHLAVADPPAFRRTQFRKRLLRSCVIATLPIWIACVSWGVAKL